MKSAILLSTCAAFTLCACATSSGNIAASYTSPMQYAYYDCGQIAMEEQMVVEHVSQLGGSIDRAATNDKIAVGVGAVLFWPALFLIKGNGEQAAEFSRLKGESEALQHAAVLKHCSADARGQVAYSDPQAMAPMPPPTPLASQMPASPIYPNAYSQQVMYYSAPAPSQSGHVTGIRVSADGSVTETRYAPN